jgi:hypothetical protein
VSGAIDGSGSDVSGDYTALFPVVKRQGRREEPAPSTEREFVSL